MKTQGPLFTRYLSRTLTLGLILTAMGSTSLSAVANESNPFYADYTHCFAIPGENSYPAPGLFEMFVKRVGDRYFAVRLIPSDRLFFPTKNFTPVHELDATFGNGSVTLSNPTYGSIDADDVGFGDRSIEYPTSCEPVLGKFSPFPNANSSRQKAINELIAFEP